MEYKKIEDIVSGSRERFLSIWTETGNEMLGIIKDFEDFLTNLAPSSTNRDQELEESSASYATIHLTPKEDEPYPLKLTNKDVGSKFKDGAGMEWKILDFTPSKEYEISAQLWMFVPLDYYGSDLYADFNQFGKRKDYKQDSDHSLKSIA